VNVDGVPYRTIWLADDGWSVEIIDQTRLPHEFIIARLNTWQDAVRAISDMLVRGAPLIGVTGAYGMCLAMHEDPSDGMLQRAAGQLRSARPTAVNLAWAIDLMAEALSPLDPGAREQASYALAAELADDDVEACRMIGVHGATLIQSVADRKSGPVNILTHCNAGWLATVDHGTALSPIYTAHDKGVPVHVWVDETRPRNQGASLTAWELGRHGVPHTLIADNTGGHLMQKGMVDLCITGTDRTAANGDVCNKIGTYLKALAAVDNDVPFYVALPHSTIDWSVHDGVTDIPIEERGGEEVTEISGRTADGAVATIGIAPAGTAAANYAFDVTPARLVTNLITERGVCDASAEGLRGLYPERQSS
jgi:methylthioribose-1-phosphate isomerase